MAVMGFEYGYASTTPDSPESHYQGQVLAATACCPIATCYALQADPQGDQASDGILQLYSNGQRFRDRNEDGDTADSGEDTWL